MFGSKVPLGILKVVLACHTDEYMRLLFSKIVIPYLIFMLFMEAKFITKLVAETVAAFEGERISGPAKNERVTLIGFAK